MTTTFSGLAERVPDFGMIPGLAEACPKDRSLEMYRRICRVREFELQCKKYIDEKVVQVFCYLSLGQESFPAALSMTMMGSWVVPQHRGHGTCLLFGMEPAKIIDELLGLETGCCKGMGGSPAIHDISKKILGHNHLIGDNVPVAVGFSYAKPGEKTICIFGDGAAEEDYVIGALGFAATHKLPMLFICDDNDLSVLTPTRDRRTWKIHEVCKAYGMEGVDIADDPWLIDHYVREFQTKLPAIINVRNCRELWHQGTGTDGAPEWNRFQITRNKMIELGLEKEITQIESEAKQEMESLWLKQLQKLSETSHAST